MSCFWQDLQGATQVCPDAPPEPGEQVFDGYNVGSAGGFYLFRSSWTGEGPSLIDEALTAERNVSLTGYMDEGDLIPVSPPVVGYYQPTGYGADPGGDPEDYQCISFFPGDLELAGLPFNVPVDVVIDFNPPSGAIALGNVTAQFGF